MIKVDVKNSVGQNAISMQSGKILYEKIYRPLSANEGVELDFDGVELFASPFFNASIGLLLKDIRVQELQKRLKITNINAVGRQLLNLVIVNAIKYYEMEKGSVDRMRNIFNSHDE